MTKGVTATASSEPELRRDRLLSLGRARTVASLGVGAAIVIAAVWLAQTDLSTHQITLVLAIFFGASSSVLLPLSAWLAARNQRLVCEVASLSARNKIIQQDLVLCRETEVRIAEERQRLEMALASGGLGLWDWNIATNEVITDRHWAAILGERLEELEHNANAWMERVHPEDRALTQQALERHLRGETPAYESTYRVRHRDGSWRWIQDRGQVTQRDEQGQPLRVVGSYGDVTANAEARAKLEENEQRMRMLVEGTDVIIWEFSFSENRFTYVSPRADQFGYPLESWLKPGFWQQHVHPEDYEAAAAFCFEETAKGRNHRLQYRMPTADGRILWIDDFVNVATSPSGEKFLRGVFVDITERKRVECALADAQRQLEAVLDAASEISVISTDASGVITIFNRGAEKMLGYTAAEMIGHKTPMTIHDSQEVEQRSRELTQQLGRRIEGFQTFVALPLRDGGERREWTYIRRDGSRTTVELYVTALKAADGSIMGFLGTAVDINDRKVAERQLSAAREEAEAANLAKSAFLANMSHEIRTPLTAILGYADVLREDGMIERAPAPRVQAIDTIRTAGQHLLTIINDILDLSKIEAGRMTVEQIETHLPAILQEIQSLMQPRAVGKGLVLTTQCETPIPEVILSDPTRLRQILMNMVGNAVKFTEAGSVTVAVGIDLESETEQLIIDVIDTGSGLTPQQAARLFQPFSQADETVTREHGGTGLGLTICQRLAELMGGQVSLASSQWGHGSRFRLQLPLFRGANSLLVTKITGPSSARRKSSDVENLTLSGRILLAEDGPDNQRFIGFILRKAGASVTIAGNGRIAHEMLKTAERDRIPYDLLLTDMQMPEMDGYSLARTLRLEGNSIPIVALTAHAMAEHRQKCLEAGCDDFSTKPIDKTALLATCATWLSKPPVSKAPVSKAAASRQTPDEE